MNKQLPENEKKEYLPPKLVDISVLPAFGANCTSGSGAADGDCLDGSNPGESDCGTGSGDN